MTKKTSDEIELFLNAMGYETPNEPVEAWNGNQFITKYLPHWRIREKSEDTGLIAPFHLRDDEDNMIGFVVPDEESPDGASSVHFYLANNDIAYDMAMYLLGEIDTEFITINNAYSNSIETVEHDYEA